MCVGALAVGCSDGFFCYKRSELELGCQSKVNGAGGGSRVDFGFDIAALDDHVLDEAYNGFFGEI